MRNDPRCDLTALYNLFLRYNKPRLYGTSANRARALHRCGTSSTAGVQVISMGAIIAMVKKLQKKKEVQCECEPQNCWVRIDRSRLDFRFNRQLDLRQSSPRNNGLRGSSTNPLQRTQTHASQKRNSENIDSKETQPVEEESVVKRLRKVRNSRKLYRHDKIEFITPQKQAVLKKTFARKMRHMVHKAQRISGKSVSDSEESIQGDDGVKEATQNKRISSDRLSDAVTSTTRNIKKSNRSTLEDRGSTSEMEVSESNQSGSKSTSPHSVHDSFDETTVPDDEYLKLKRARANPEAEADLEVESGSTISNSADDEPNTQERPKLQGPQTEGDIRSNILHESPVQAQITNSNIQKTITLHYCSNLLQDQNVQEASRMEPNIDNPPQNNCSTLQKNVIELDSEYPEVQHVVEENTDILSDAQINSTLQEQIQHEHPTENKRPVIKFNSGTKKPEHQKNQAIVKPQENPLFLHIGTNGPVHRQYPYFGIMQNAPNPNVRSTNNEQLISESPEPADSPNSIHIQSNSLDNFHLNIHQNIMVNPSLPLDLLTDESQSDQQQNLPPTRPPNRQSSRPDQLHNLQSNQTPNIQANNQRNAASNVQSNIIIGPISVQPNQPSNLESGYIELQNVLKTFDVDENQQATHNLNVPREVYPQMVDHNYAPSPQIMPQRVYTPNIAQERQVLPPMPQLIDRHRRINANHVTPAPVMIGLNRRTSALLERQLPLTQYRRASVGQMTPPTYSDVAQSSLVAYNTPHLTHAPNSIYSNQLIQDERNRHFLNIIRNAHTLNHPRNMPQQQNLPVPTISNRSNFYNNENHPPIYDHSAIKQYLINRHLSQIATVTSDQMPSNETHSTVSQLLVHNIQGTSATVTSAHPSQMPELNHQQEPLISHQQYANQNRNRTVISGSETQSRIVRACSDKEQQTFNTSAQLKTQISNTSQQLKRSKIKQQNNQQVNVPTRSDQQTSKHMSANTSRIIFPNSVTQTLGLGTNAAQLNASQLSENNQQTLAIPLNTSAQLKTQNTISSKQSKRSKNKQKNKQQKLLGKQQINTPKKATAEQIISNYRNINKSKMNLSISSTETLSSETNEQMDVSQLSENNQQTLGEPLNTFIQLNTQNTISPEQFNRSNIELETNQQQSPNKPQNNLVKQSTANQQSSKQMNTNNSKIHIPSSTTETQGSATNETQMNVSQLSENNQQALIISTTFAQLKTQNTISPERLNRSNIELQKNQQQFLDKQQINLLKTPTAAQQTSEQMNTNKSKINPNSATEALGSEANKKQLNASQLPENPLIIPLKTSAQLKTQHTISLEQMSKSILELQKIQQQLLDKQINLLKTSTSDQHVSKQMNSNKSKNLPNRATETLDLGTNVSQPDVSQLPENKQETLTIPLNTSATLKTQDTIPPEQLNRGVIELQKQQLLDKQRINLMKTSTANQQTSKQININTSKIISPNSATQTLEWNTSAILKIQNTISPKQLQTTSAADRQTITQINKNTSKISLSKSPTGKIALETNKTQLNVSQLSENNKQNQMETRQIDLESSCTCTSIQLLEIQVAPQESKQLINNPSKDDSKTASIVTSNASETQSTVCQLPETNNSQLLSINLQNNETIIVSSDESDTQSHEPQLLELSKQSIVDRQKSSTVPSGSDKMRQTFTYKYEAKKYRIKVPERLKQQQALNKAQMQNNEQGNKIKNKSNHQKCIDPSMASNNNSEKLVEITKNAEKQKDEKIKNTHLNRTPEIPEVKTEVILISDDVIEIEDDELSATSLPSATLLQSPRSILKTPTPTPMPFISGESNNPRRITKRRHTTNAETAVNLEGYISDGFANRRTRRNHRSQTPNGSQENKPRPQSQPPNRDVKDIFNGRFSTRNYFGNPRFGTPYSFLDGKPLPARSQVPNLPHTLNRNYFENDINTNRVQTHNSNFEHRQSSRSQTPYMNYYDTGPRICRRQIPNHLFENRPQRSRSHFPSSSTQFAENAQGTSRFTRTPTYFPENRYQRLRSQTATVTSGQFAENNFGLNRPPRPTNRFFENPSLSRSGFNSQFEEANRPPRAKTRRFGTEQDDYFSYQGNSYFNNDTRGFGYVSQNFGPRSEHLMNNPDFNQPYNYNRFGSNQSINNRDRVFDENRYMDRNRRSHNNRSTDENNRFFDNFMGENSNVNQNNQFLTPNEPVEGHECPDENILNIDDGRETDSSLFLEENLSAFSVDCNSTDESEPFSTPFNPSPPQMDMTPRSRFDHGFWPVQNQREHNINLKILNLCKDKRLFRFYEFVTRVQINSRIEPVSLRNFIRLLKEGKLRYYKLLFQRYQQFY